MPGPQLEALTVVEVAVRLPRDRAAVGRNASRYTRLNEVRFTGQMSSRNALASTPAGLHRCPGEHQHSET